MAYSLTIKNINKSFGDFQALRNISFSVEGGQFVTLLGPSGCGENDSFKDNRRISGAGPGRYIFLGNAV